MFSRKSQSSFPRVHLQTCSPEVLCWYYCQLSLVTGINTTPVTNVLSVTGVTTMPVTYFSFHQKFISRVHISPAFPEFTKSQKHITQNTQFIFRDHITYIYIYKYILAVTQIQCLLHITYILAGTQGQTKAVCLNQYRHSTNIFPPSSHTSSDKIRHTK